MRLPIVSRRRSEAELADAKAEAQRQRQRAERAETIARTEVRDRRRISAMYSDLFDELTQSNRRNQGLCTQLDEAKDAAGLEAQARQSADRIARLQKAVARARAEAAEERYGHRAVQRQLDDALGPNDPAITEGARWQERRHDKPRTVKEATAS
ncbi:MAG: hypothetical protein HOY79_01830 [Streptomyces sp.]|nr:hypothetical protein [Streptomyces sp.]